MQLRHHPLVKFHGRHNWLPVWVRLGRAHAKSAEGAERRNRYYPAVEVRLL